MSRGQRLPSSRVDYHDAIVFRIIEGGRNARTKGSGLEPGADLLRYLAVIVRIVSVVIRGLDHQQIAQANNIHEGDDMRE